MYEGSPNTPRYERKIHIQPLAWWYLASRTPFWAWLIFVGISLVPADPLETVLSFVLIFEVICLIPTAICLGSLATIQKIIRTNADYRQWKAQLFKHVTTWPLIGGAVTFFAGFGLNFNGTNAIETLTVTAAIVGGITVFVIILNLLAALLIAHKEKKKHPEYTRLATNLP